MISKGAEPTTPGDCDRCGKPLPPRVGAGRPRKRHASCSGPRHDAQGRLRKQPRDDVGVTITTPRAELVRFGPRGAALWRAMVDALPGPLHQDLLIEACRLADRCDRLDALLRGERASWAVLQLGDISESTGALEITVVVSSIVIEARNSATALKALVAELRQAMREAGADTGDTPTDAIDDLLGEIAADDELAKRRRSHGSAS
jgi:hypothetical protein